MPLERSAGDSRRRCTRRSKDESECAMAGHVALLLVKCDFWFENRGHDVTAISRPAGRLPGTTQACRGNIEASSTGAMSDVHGDLTRFAERCRVQDSCLRLRRRRLPSRSRDPWPRYGSDQKRDQSLASSFASLELAAVEGSCTVSRARVSERRRSRARVRHAGVSPGRRHRADQRRSADDGSDPGNAAGARRSRQTPVWGDARSRGSSRGAAEEAVGRQDGARRPADWHRRHHRAAAPGWRRSQQRDISEGRVPDSH